MRMVSDDDGKPVTRLSNHAGCFIDGRNLLHKTELKNSKVFSPFLLLRSGYLVTTRPLWKG